MHLSEDDLQRYVYGRLESAETDTVEAHLPGCDQCAGLLNTALGFFRGAAELKPKNPHWTEEQRREPRFSAGGSGSLQALHPLNLTRTDIQVVDVSKNGIKVSAPHPVDIGAIVRVRLKHTFILGEVRNCSETREGFEIGVQIHDVANALPGGS
jgi:hypothetical protein